MVTRLQTIIEVLRDMIKDRITYFTLSYTPSKLCRTDRELHFFTSIFMYLSTSDGCFNFLTVERVNIHVLYMYTCTC